MERKKQNKRMEQINFFMNNVLCIEEKKWNYPSTFLSDDVDLKWTKFWILN